MLKTKVFVWVTVNCFHKTSKFDIHGFSKKGKGIT